MPSKLGVIFDLDQTLVDSLAAEPLRRSRDWPAVYKLVPSFRPYDGICELLVELNTRNVPVCIVTNGQSRYAGLVLKHCNIPISELVCYHDVPKGEHKPHPTPIRLGIAKLQLEPKYVVAVGDDPKDVVAAKAAGVLAVGVTWGTVDKAALLAAKPDFVCPDVASLREFLLAKLT
jgi:phosphoglycolate phosphatase-like HAD superfamily hydrolase